MSLTENLKLHLRGTSEDDNALSFEDFRLEINGEGEDSNMMIIDKEIQQIKDSQIKKVCGKDPSEDGNIAITASDVNARPNNWTPNAEEVHARPDNWTPNADEVGAVPKSSFVNISSIYLGENPPDAPVEGMIWFCPVTG